MSDVLPQIEPETQGHVTKLDVGLGSFLQHSFQAGQTDSMMRAVSNTTEDMLANHPGNSKLLDPDTATEKYGVGDLKFKQPIQEELAAAMSEREKTKMDHQMFLASGTTKGRFLPGMAASILGATANPLDFGSMFIPFVGEGKVLEEGSVVARALSRGLIPAETIAKSGIPLPKLVGSMAQAAIWGGMADVPKMYEAHIEGQEQPHLGADMLGQVAFAGILHGGQAAFAGILHGVGEGLKFLRPETHEAMCKQAVNDFLSDKEFSAHTYIPMDEHVLQFQAVQKEIALRHEAEGSIDLKKIAEDFKDKNLEYSVNAALRLPPDEHGEQAIHTGPTHWAIPGADEFPEGTERGMWTNKGRFVSMEEAEKLHGLPQSEHPTSENILYGAESHDEMSPNERKVYSDLLDKGFSDSDARATVNSERKEKMEKAFFSKPEVQAEIEKQRQVAIDKWVEDKKKELANPVSKETLQAAAEKTVDDKTVEKYNGDDTHLNKMLDEDLEGLTGDKPEKQDVNPDFMKYQELTESMKGKSLDEAHDIAKQVNYLKNKYGGAVPPEKMPIPNAIDAALGCLIKKIL